MAYRIFIALFWLHVPFAQAYTPPASYIIEHIVQRNAVKELKATLFNAFLSSDNEHKPTELALTNKGLKEGEKTLDLHVLNILISSPNTQALTNYLLKQNINLDIINLGFFGNEPVYIIGAKPGDLRAPQLWVNKTKYYIIREIGKNHEIIFDKWEAIRSPKAQFPRLIAIAENKKLNKYSLAERINR